MLYLAENIFIKYFGDLAHIQMFYFFIYVNIWKFDQKKFDQKGLPFSSFFSILLKLNNILSFYNEFFLHSFLLLSISLASSSCAHFKKVGGLTRSTLAASLVFISFLFHFS